jgi:hypothetical protein
VVFLEHSGGQWRSSVEAERSGEAHDSCAKWPRVNGELMPGWPNTKGDSCGPLL